MEAVCILTAQNQPQMPRLHSPLYGFYLFIYLCPPPLPLRLWLGEKAFEGKQSAAVFEVPAKKSSGVFIEIQAFNVV